MQVFVDILSLKKNEVMWKKNKNVLPDFFDQVKLSIVFHQRMYKILGGWRPASRERRAATSTNTNSKSISSCFSEIMRQQNYTINCE